MFAEAVNRCNGWKAILERCGGPRCRDPKTVFIRETGVSQALAFDADRIGDVAVGMLSIITLTCFKPSKVPGTVVRVLDAFRDDEVTSSVPDFRRFVGTGRCRETDSKISVRLRGDAIRSRSRRWPTSRHSATLKAARSSASASGRLSRRWRRRSASPRPGRINTGRPVSFALSRRETRPDRCTQRRLARGPSVVPVDDRLDFFRQIPRYVTKPSFEDRYTVLASGLASRLTIRVGAPTRGASKSPTICTIQRRAIARDASDVRATPFGRRESHAVPDSLPRVVRFWRLAARSAASAAEGQPVQGDSGAAGRCGSDRCTVSGSRRPVRELRRNCAFRVVAQWT